MTRRSFDGQASTFDERAGLPAESLHEVAATVVELAGLHTEDLLVEVGAGSGEIGCHLVERVRYVGFDLAAPMLEVFRGRLGDRGTRAQLVVADGDQAWPVLDGSARAVFGSRCLHLLALSHLLAELERVRAPEGMTLVIGRVVRDDTCVRMWMRRRMRRLLHEAGIEGRPGGGAFTRDLLEACGGEPIAPRVAAAWSVATSPADALAAWESKDGLAGVAVDPRTKRDVLERLRGHAEYEFGDLDTQITTTEEYILTGVHFS